MVLSPWKVTTVSAIAVTASALCVRIISRRRSTASAITPPISQQIMMGTTRTSRTMSSARPFWSSGTSSDTCQRMAAFCIIEPEKEISCPIQSRRKLRWRSAINCWRRYARFINGRSAVPSGAPIAEIYEVVAHSAVAELGDQRQHALELVAPDAVGHGLHKLGLVAGRHA